MRKLLAALALAASAIAVEPSEALTFNLIDTGGTAMGTQARRGFETAARYWSSVLTNDATINLDIGFQRLGPNILGSTGSSTGSLLVGHAYQELAANAQSQLDRRAVAGLQPLALSANPVNGAAGNAALAAITNDFATSDQRGYTAGATRLDDDGSINNVVLDANTAVMKALGLSFDDDGNALADQIDGSIVFSNQFAFDFDPTDGVDAGSYDFLGVAIHEIGHALGFVSGVDTYDIVSLPGSPIPDGETKSLGELLRDGELFDGIYNLEDDFRIATTLDLFRYSAPGQLDWSTGGTRYISADGGLTALFGNTLSTGQFNGDGYQASHWKDSAGGLPQLGVMDPTSARGQVQDVTALDLGAFDLLGWNTNVDVLSEPGYRRSIASIFAALGGNVPEPASWATMLAGFGLIGAAARRRPAAA